MLRIVQANFVAPTPKKAVTINLGSGLSVLPGSIFHPSNAFIHHLECIHAFSPPEIAKYPRPKKPIILYEFEASGDCKCVLRCPNSHTYIHKYMHIRELFI